ncbi:helix-turn-helix domain-containing protein [Sphaerisporangium corydalis]|uniref:Helix-turn-helix domain-containing protein n=1 Tax=Sphaerisporangium corydalis TaxID=1441875 RepID=A0ABV9EMQ0_9ACTN|nr:helix-turn-helix transcriptional regulator [Sphaerisporangium corydalis]
MALRRQADRPAFEQRQSAEPGGLAQEITDEITWYMREHKISRADLAALMGVSAGRVSQILSGDENLTLRTVGAVLDALGTRFEFSLNSLGVTRELLEDR